ncbi:1-aminocyclopropane-1-carboxylate deaminase/D-cysteine desulfhydrase [Flavobacterium aciduliphilum]|uniref:1-aminocyclopropane-1-carboxylate deaminase n=1 Tax=Flavobacterium aciduliphilum TaxID=1101402 RepID=A0A328YJ88_9FLAO|nr:pyridoxal-phosphate dependent enzyme [Flavobacterium aciduliphilum]RAR74218.1 1-aminocyclopropane-1-carboxylate deaminase [Flavobacterium aciduliphilum]
MKVLTQEIKLDTQNIRLFIKREDLIHPFISGNKYRKLKYNLIQAQNEQKKTLLTFGGAYSNHIAATAYAGMELGLKTIGVIRGDELAGKIDQNPTLTFAQKWGMKFVFISRTHYRMKSEAPFIDDLHAQFGDFYLVPEGGTNTLAIKGCEEILEEEDQEYDFICCAVGTGGTMSGIINAAKPHQKVLGFPSLKGDFLSKDIAKFVTKNNPWELITSYNFGGYGKISEPLLMFLNDFYQIHKIPLDPIYTGKMVFGVMDLIRNNYFPSNSKILLIHTGGLQGIEGMNLKLKKKNIQTIHYND